MTNGSGGAVSSRRWGTPIVRVIACLVAVVSVGGLLNALPLDDVPFFSALSLFFVVFTVSTFWGFGYALLTSLLASLVFIWLAPPTHSWRIDDSRDFFALLAFLIIAISGSHLSGRIRTEASNAERRRAEAVAAQERFRDLVNSVEGIVWEADAQTFAFSFVSDQAERILGYPTERWLDEPAFWKDHVHPEDRDRAVEFSKQAAAEKLHYDFEYRMIAADGRAVWIRDLVAVVVENGRPTKLRGVMVDISDRRQKEEALREQANLLSLTHDAIFVRDMNAAIRYWNRGAEEMYGWSAEEAAGKVSHELLKTVFPVPLDVLINELTRSGRWEGELVHTKKSGTQVVVASRWSLQRDQRGSPLAVLEINNDITPRKQAEEARRDIEEQWRAAFESNPTMYFILDVAGTIVTVNKFGASQLGYAEDELIGKPVLSIFYEPDRQFVQKHARTCFDEPGRTMRWEARKIRKDGTVIWVRETANAVLLKKKPVLLVVCEDITEQKRAEEAARQSARELREVIESIPTMAWTASPDGSSTFVNKRWTEYTGLSVEETAGSGWQDVVHADDLVRYARTWRVSVETGTTFEEEVRFRRAADGEFRWFLVRGVPLRDDDGNIVRWYGIAADIEDRKRAELERERLRQLEAKLAHINRVTTMGELTASLAHEINQPIAAAMTNASTCLRWLAAEEPNVEEARQAAGRILKDSQRAAEIIIRLRSLFKKGATEREPVDINEIIEDMVVLLRNETARHRISIRMDLAADLPKVVGDRVQLQQVLMNLMMNGIDAIRDFDASNRRELTLTSRCNGSGELLVSISDTGIGLPPDPGQIFEAFFTTKPDGTGMGLAISRTIIEAHGGRLWATSNPQGGAAFNFTLPTLEA